MLRPMNHDVTLTMPVPNNFLFRVSGFGFRVSGMSLSLQRLTLVVAAPLGALAISVMLIGWALVAPVNRRKPLLRTAL